MHISKSEKSSYYTVATQQDLEKGIVTPLPKVYNPIIMSFEQWYDKYKTSITEMTSYIMEKLFTLTSDKYIANFNVSIIKKELVDLFYRTSHNRYRNYV